MARGLNRADLIGHVGADPEVRTFGTDIKVAKFSLATNRTWNDRNGQQQEKVEWHRVSVFGRLADIVEKYVRKGDRLYVSGRIEYSQTEDDQGNVRYWTDIVAQELLMLGSAGDGESSQRSAPAQRPAPQRSPRPFDDRDDDLPF